MQKVIWLLLGEKWLKAEPRWQPNSKGFLLRLRSLYKKRFGWLRRHGKHIFHWTFPFSLFCPLFTSESLRCCLLNQNGCVCRGKENEGMRGRRWCWGDRDGEVFVCARGGGYEWEMSCSDVTSAVSRQDAGMCHTDEGRGRIGKKSKCTMKWFIPPPPIQSCCFICGRCSIYQTWMLSRWLAEMLMSVWTREKADAELFRSLSKPSEVDKPRKP